MPAQIFIIAADPPVNPRCSSDRTSGSVCPGAAVSATSFLSRDSSNSGAKGGARKSAAPRRMASTASWSLAAVPRTTTGRSERLWPTRKISDCRAASPIPCDTKTTLQGRRSRAAVPSSSPGTVTTSKPASARILGNVSLGATAHHEARAAVSGSARFQHSPAQYAESAPAFNAKRLGASGPRTPPTALRENRAPAGAARLTRFARCVTPSAESNAGRSSLSAARRASASWPSASARRSSRARSDAGRPSFRAVRASGGEPFQGRSAPRARGWCAPPGAPRVRWRPPPDATPRRSAGASRCERARHSRADRCGWAAAVRGWAYSRPEAAGSDGRLRRIEGAQPFAARAGAREQRIGQIAELAHSFRVETGVAPGKIDEGAREQRLRRRFGPAPIRGGDAPPALRLASSSSKVRSPPDRGRARRATDRPRRPRAVPAGCSGRMRS